MSKEYIEREKALEKVIEVKHHDPELNGVVLHRYIKEIDLKDIPAADVAPVAHGEWIERALRPNCSLCGFSGSLIDAPISPFKYCPNCGAKMDKEEADELD